MGEPGELDWMKIDAEICLDLIDSEPDWIGEEWFHQQKAKRKLVAILKTLAGRS